MKTCTLGGSVHLEVAGWVERRVSAALLPLLTNCSGNCFRKVHFKLCTQFSTNLLEVSLPPYLSNFSPQVWLCHQRHLLTLQGPRSQFLLFTPLKEGSSSLRLGSFTLKLISCRWKHASDYWPEATLILYEWVIGTMSKLTLKVKVKKNPTKHWGMKDDADTQQHIYKMILWSSRCENSIVEEANHLWKCCVHMSH